MTSLHTLFSKRTAQLAFIAAAGVASVSAGSAQAFVLSPTVVNGFTFTPVTNSASGSLDIDPDGAHGVVLTGTFSPTFRNGAEQFIYDVTAPAGKWFSKVTLSTFTSAAPTQVTKGISYGATTVNLVSNNFVSGALTSSATLAGMPTTLRITDTYFAVDTGRLALISNSFEAVPGPVPVLGAAAFFGYSRKLRSRIKASKAQSSIA